MSSILSTAQGQGLQYLPPSLSSAGSFVSTSQTTVSEADTEVAQASVSLSANLNNVTAATGTGQLTLAFARALQGATEVDPTTGHREIIAGANAQLTSTLDSLLVQNGFTTAQAATATANLATELAQGGPITLSASYDEATQASGSVSSNYASGAASSVSAVDATDRSSSITIGIDLDTGELNVSLKAQNSSVYSSSGKVTGSGTLAAPIGQLLLLPASDLSTNPGSSNASSASQSDFGQVLSNQSLTALPSLSSLPAAALGTVPSGFGTASANSPLSESEVDTFAYEAQTTLSLTNTSSANGAENEVDGAQNQASGAAGANAPSISFYAVDAGSTRYASALAQNAAAGSATGASAETTLQQLLAELNKTTLLAQQQAAELLQNLAQISASAKAAAQNKNSATVSDNTSDATDATAGASGNAAAGPTAGNTVSVEIGITQTVAIQQLDLNGYGDTLYKRPDGSLGKISTQPTYVTA